MVREIVEVKSDEYKLKIPGEYMHRKIEILILPYDIDRESVKSECKKDFIQYLVDNPLPLDDRTSFLTRDAANER